MAQELVLIPKSKYDYLLKKDEEHKSNGSPLTVKSEETLNQQKKQTEKQNKQPNISIIKPKRLYVKTKFSSLENNIQETRKKEKRSGEQKKAQIQRKWAVYNI